MLGSSLKGFYLLFTGQAFSLFGSRLVRFAIVWWLTSETGSASVLAFATIMALLPQVVLGPFAGTLVDMWKRRKVMIIADVTTALSIMVLVLLFYLDLAKIWHIYMIMLVGSLSGAFHWPAMQATTTLMVPKDHYSRVAGFNQSLIGMANIATPPLGALLFELVSMEVILSLDIFTSILALLPLLFVSIPQPPGGVNRGSNLNSVIVGIKEGGSFVWSWKGLRYIMTMAMIINLLTNPAFSLIPILVTNHFNGGALELAWLQSANGVGMLLGGLLLGAWGGFKKRIVTAMSAVTLSGISIAIIGLLPPSLFFLAVVAAFFFAFMNAIANGTFFASMQSTVPPEMQGRVFTILMSLSAGMSPIGLAIAGPVADAVGENVWFLIGGTSLMIMGCGSFFIPSIMNIEAAEGVESPKGHPNGS